MLLYRNCNFGNDEFRGSGDDDNGHILLNVTNSQSVGSNEKQYHVNAINYWNGSFQYCYKMFINHYDMADYYFLSWDIFQETVSDICINDCKK